MTAEAWFAAGSLIFTIVVTSVGGIAVLVGMRADIRHVTEMVRSAVAANDREHTEFRRDIRDHGEQIAGLRAEVGNGRRAAA